MALGAESTRSDWTDNDLLTLDEAGERLEQEEAQIAARLGELEAADSSVDERDQLQVRLNAVRSLRRTLKERATARD